jgi:hypothetical protein
MSTPKIYDMLDGADIPSAEIPQEHIHNRLDVHGPLYVASAPSVGLALGSGPFGQTDRSEFTLAFVPLPETSVVKNFGWDGPFDSPEYSIYTTANMEARIFAGGDTYEGKPVPIAFGREIFYYGTESAGYWRGWEEHRRESGPFVSIRKGEVSRLCGDFGFGMVMWMGIGGWSVLNEPETEGRWIVEVGGDRWASQGWEPGDGFPHAVAESHDRAQRELCEIMLGRSMTDEEFQSLRQ